MAEQEGALYGDLVLWLRDRAAELLAGEAGDVVTQQTCLDGLIREWFFAPQDALHGCASREIIWAEQNGRPNPIRAEYLDDMFPDDCEICAMERREVEASLAAGEEPAMHWYYSDGGYPLIARYDPEEWDRQGEEELAKFEAWQAEQQAAPATSDGQPLDGPQAMTPDQFAQMLLRPLVGPEIRQAAEKLAAHCDVPVPHPFRGLRYRRVTRDEAISLLGGLERHGTSLADLLGEIDAWPYENVALDWLSEPEQNAAMMCQALDQSLTAQDTESVERLRHHRDFCFALAGIVPPAAQIWLQGWLEAIGRIPDPPGPDNPF